MKAITLILITGFSILGMLFLLGLRVNTSPSIPMGIYWQHHTAILRDSLIGFCPPKIPVIEMAKERGYLTPGLCDSGTRPLIKRVVALSGDRVQYDNDSIRINSTPVPNSASMHRDNRGRVLPSFSGEMRLAENQILPLALGNPRSFDGRYFGPVDTKLIQGTLKPLWVFNH